MNATNNLTGLALSIVLIAFTDTATAADPGLITKRSRYSVKETVERFETAVKAKEANGFMVFAEIDHSAAAKKFGLEMLPRTVIVLPFARGGRALGVKIRRAARIRQRV